MSARYTIERGSLPADGYRIYAEGRVCVAAGATERDAARIVAILVDSGDVLDPDTADHVRLSVGLVGIDGAVY